MSERTEAAPERLIPSPTRSSYVPVRSLTDRLKMPMLKGGLVAVVLVLAFLGGKALARESAVHPIPIPAAHAKARARCPLNKPLVCRAALIHAYEAIAWQRRARWHDQANKVDDVTRDAIHWAAWKYGHGVDGQLCARCRALELQMLGIGRCESHLFLWAVNGQYKSWAQLSARHRSDPIIQRLTWRDPYAAADHVARYLIAHGEGEWQCVSTGGLRW